MLQEETCASCVFYMAGPKVCRRYPPLPIMVGVEQGIAGLAGMQPKPAIMPFFPTMMPSGWCGEYRSNDLPPMEN